MAAPEEPKETLEEIIKEDAVALLNQANRLLRHIKKVHDEKLIKLTDNELQNIDDWLLVFRTVQVSTEIVIDKPTIH